jgi:pimeloyl-ACP methyl ester carboxylesterase
VGAADRRPIGALPLHRPRTLGHGRSDPLPEIPYSLDGVAEDYWTFAQALGLERFALLGLSVGGMWGMRLTLNHPEAVEALVLMDTDAGDEPAESQAGYFQMLDVVEQAGVMPPPIVQAATPFFFAQVTMDRERPFVAAYQQRLGATPPENIPSIVALGRAIFGRDSILDEVDEIETPTLIVVGEGDRSRPVPESQALAERIPNAQLAIIPEAGHICTIEQPERVNQVLLNFLESVL